MSRRFDVITFDCYGTLVDWDAGIGGAIVEAAAKAGIDVGRDEIMHVYHEVEPVVQARAYMSYREVLCEAAVQVAKRVGWELEPDAAEFLPASLPRWPQFADTSEALSWMKNEGYALGILSNVDDDLLAGTREGFPVEFELLVTAQQVGSYKPAHGHFEEARERIGDRRWLHAAQSYFHDIAPAADLGLDSFWVNRKREEPSGDARPLAQSESLSGFVDWLKQQ